jgi:DNA polymerase III alpha subunit
MNYEILNNSKSIKLIKKFKRKLPREEIYLDRLCEELSLIIEKKFDKHLKLVIKILELVDDIPHIIRGSSGSSLVCYCLGITNIDPVKEKISFARFLNDKRENMPDIDMDFPYHLREKVFERIEDKFKKRVARISNHLYYREKSALRQAFRECGYRKLIPKNRLSVNYIPEIKDLVLNKYEELKNEFRGYSLHCGGIVIYKKEIPKELILKNNQIKYNKDDVAKKELFKIDILSNRGLAQLYSISNREIEHYPDNDIKVIKLLSKGKNIGLTFGESPAMRKVLRIVKPKNIQQLALCLALRVLLLS